jgi:hypothetical protein
MLKRIAIIVAGTAASAVLAVGLVAAGFGPVADDPAEADQVAAGQGGAAGGSGASGRPERARKRETAAAVVTFATDGGAIADVGDGPSLPRFAPVARSLPATPALALGVWVPTPGIEAAPGAVAAAYAPIVQTETEVVYIAPQPTPKVVHVVKRTRQAAAVSTGSTGGSSGGSSRSRASRGGDDDDDEHEHEEREHEDHEREGEDD